MTRKTTKRTSGDLSLSLSVNAIQVLERRYLLRDNRGRVVETPAELFRRVARVMARIEKTYGGSAEDVSRWQSRYEEMMTSRAFLPNTPTLMNAGAPLGQLAACFVLPIEDSIVSIFDTLKASAEIHQSGGGTGFDFSNIRPEGDLVMSTGGKASGPVSFMKIFETVTDVIKQGGKRRGANMGVLRVDHPDIVDFVTAKAEAGRFKNFNLSVAVTDAFMRAVERGGSVALRNPRTGRTVAKKPARELWNLITTSAWQSGDPGVLFIDEINRKNPTRFLGEIAATNPCGEQPLHPWEACNLGSVNLERVVGGELGRGRVDWEKLRLVVRDAVRFLDSVVDANRYPLPEVKRMNLANRRIGLGVMGFAEMLIRLGIPYDSPRAVTTAERLMSFVTEQARAASADLARERGSFPNFKKSTWPKRGWRAMRNATVTTIAPTGTISILADCSSGIEPLFAISFVRNVMEGSQLIESSPLFEAVARMRGFWSDKLEREIAKTGSVQHIEEVPGDIKRLFRTALEIPVAQHVKIQAAFQKHTDNAVSKTINLPEEASAGDVRRAFMTAWKLKCKGITVYRYGSKPEQVLTVGGNGDPHAIIAQSEYSGGCLAGVCAYQQT